MVAEKFENTDAALIRVLNLMVLMMNWLHLGQPNKAPVNYAASAPLTGEQWGIVRRLKHLASHWNKADAVSADRRHGPYRWTS